MPRRLWQHQGRSARCVSPQGAFFLTPHSQHLKRWPRFPRRYSMLPE